MPECERCKLFSWDVEGNLEEGVCILHSENFEKDKETFAKALEEHRKNKGDNFAFLVFPGKADFRGCMFAKETNFSGVTFVQEADFSDATFTEDANFVHATFYNGANFSEATFKKEADFRGCMFAKETANFFWTKFHKRTYFGGARFTQGAYANFVSTTFSHDAYFGGTMFCKGADFHESTFTQEADFSSATFCGMAKFVEVRFKEEANFDSTTFNKGATFSKARFLGRTLFASRKIENGQTSPTSPEAVVYFRDVTIDPPDAMTFRVVDLRMWRFLDTDLRKVQLTGVVWLEVINPWIRRVAEWPWIGYWIERWRIGRRVAVYDEIEPLTLDEDRLWPRIEQLYRQLKQNYEEQRDYQRVGDFHYGEKEARRRNTETPIGLWLLLSLYCWMSGYGERALRPLLWSGLVLIGSAFFSLCLSLKGVRAEGCPEELSLYRSGDWLQALHYGFRTMTFLNPDKVAIPVGYARVVQSIQSLIGPLLFGLFALAVRQKLKR